MNLTEDFKQKVFNALLEQRKNYGGNDKAFATSYGLHPSIWSRIKGGEAPGQLVSQGQILHIARELNVSANERKWNMARTEVYDAISDDVITCQKHSKAMVLVDDCAIGKTYTAKHLSKKLINCFYVDASQCKTKQLFVRSFAKAIGVDSDGKVAHVKENIKYYLSNVLQKPIVIIDEAGDLDYGAFLELKEFWNATENMCGWYMMGADGLRTKIEKGVRGKKVGFREILSRYSNKFMKIVPIGQEDRNLFYRKLITDVLSVNTADKAVIEKLVKQCLATGTDVGGLRRAETLLLLNGAA
ncbi:MAG: ATP-binding protein [Sphingobacteriales bacterium]|nr:ATP-binding protein [Sphingobacteriales bacterium]